MAGTAVVATHALTRDFGVGEDALRALDAVDLRVEKGEVVGLLGHNGAGKTTAVRLLNGVLTPSSGSATVLGLDPAKDGPALRARTGVLTETPALDDRLSANDTLILFGQMYGLERSLATARAAELLERFGLEDRARDKVGSYSKGMRQRLALARTLLHDPELLFLDEPTAGLDPVAAREVHERITRLATAEGRSVVLCTHDLQEAQRLCDRVVLLQRGRVVAQGSPAELARGVASRRSARIDVEPSQLGTALALVGPGARAGSEAGEIVLAHASRDALADLVRSLVTNDVRVFAVVPTETTLEDVYFALMEAGTPGESGRRRAAEVPSGAGTRRGTGRT
ncbi:MAG: ABC transporter ATP-binding protein [Trueperaceae bacterium]